MSSVRSYLPGLLLCTLLAACAIVPFYFKPIEQAVKVSPLLLVIVFGMVLRAVWQLPEVFQPGIGLAQKAVLRWAVGGLGLKLSLQELWSIGGSALTVVVLSTLATLGFGVWCGRKLGLTSKMSTLLAVGSSICGASAVVAADSVVQGEKRDSAVSLGVITLLGTIGIIIYPLIGHALGLTPALYGIWDGASLHEMAQVVAAADAFGRESVDVATVAKLARICLLAPVVFYLAWSLRHAHKEAGKAKVQIVPWFLVVFVLLAGVNSLGVLGKDFVKQALHVDLWMLCIGMAGVGLQIRFSELRAAGFRPVLAGALQWVFLAAVSLGLVWWLCR